MPPGLPTERTVIDNKEKSSSCSFTVSGTDQLLLPTIAVRQPSVNLSDFRHSHAVFYLFITCAYDASTFNFGGSRGGGGGGKIQGPPTSFCLCHADACPLFTLERGANLFLCLLRPSRRIFAISHSPAFIVIVVIQP